MVDKKGLVRLKGIRSKVDTLESLHKSCQLSKVGLNEPILNEARYLARALADTAYFLVEDDNESFLKFLTIAELAAHNAINDSVDILVTFVKSGLASLIKDYPNFKIAVSEYGKQYIEALEAMETIDSMVVFSRKNRTDRVSIYCKLASDYEEELEKISSFALKLSLIESIAQKANVISDYKDNDVSAYIRSALNSKDKSSNFMILLQPKYEITKNGDVCIGAEALCRLVLDGNMISPNVFITHAEKHGTIPLITEWVIGAVIELLKLHKEIPKISLNISAADLKDVNFSDKLMQLIRTSKISSSRLELEITEREAVTDDASYDHLKKLSEKGVKISVDDFGTGDTRFDYLAKFKINTIKIDMSLVQKFIESPIAYTPLLKAINSVGKTCVDEVIAEGVETKGDVDALEKIGIKKFQGYYFAKPLELSAFLSDHSKNFLNS